MEDKKELFSKIKRDMEDFMGWCWWEKATLMAELIVEKNCQEIVELGIYGGRSLAPMAMACQFKGSGKVTGIDAWSASAALEGKNHPSNDEWWSSRANLNEVYNQFVRGIQKHNLGNWCAWHKMKSLEAVDLFKEASIDFMHQDSNHSEEVSCEEINRWWGKVRQGALWVLDDSDWPTNQRAIAILNQSCNKVLYHDPKFMIFQK